ncbi:hypothetical protein [Nitrobacter sp. TKz-YC01]|uniref:hypothetical protein n=1 Tax=Nitrobacter sp. TKz-YC01 TaxID=3398703 RepID=UPI003A0FC4EC
MSEPLWNDTDDPFIWYDVPPMVVEHIANLQNGFRGVDFVLTSAIDLLDAGDVNSTRELLETALAELRAATRVN